MTTVSCSVAPRFAVDSARAAPFKDPLSMYEPHPMVKPSKGQLEHEKQAVVPVSSTPWRDTNLDDKAFAAIADHPVLMLLAFEWAGRHEAVSYWAERIATVHGGDPLHYISASATLAVKIAHADSSANVMTPLLVQEFNNPQMYQGIPYIDGRVQEVFFMRLFQGHDLTLRQEAADWKACFPLSALRRGHGQVRHTPAASAVTRTNPYTEYQSESNDYHLVTIKHDLEGMLSRTSAKMSKKAPKRDERVFVGQTGSHKKVQKLLCATLLEYFRNFDQICGMEELGRNGVKFAPPATWIPILLRAGPDSPLPYMRCTETSSKKAIQLQPAEDGTELISVPTVNTDTEGIVIAQADSGYQFQVLKAYLPPGLGPRHHLTAGTVTE